MTGDDGYAMEGFQDSIPPDALRVVRFSSPLYDVIVYQFYTAVKHLLVFSPQKKDAASKGPVRTPKEPVLDALFLHCHPMTRLAERNGPFCLSCCSLTILAIG